MSTPPSPFEVPATLGVAFIGVVEDVASPHRFIRSATPTPTGVIGFFPSPLLAAAFSLPLVGDGCCCFSFAALIPPPIFLDDAAFCGVGCDSFPSPVEVAAPQRFNRSCTPIPTGDTAPPPPVVGSDDSGVVASAGNGLADDVADGTVLLLPAFV